MCRLGTQLLLTRLSNNPEKELSYNDDHVNDNDDDDDYDDDIDDDDDCVDTCSAVHAEYIKRYCIGAM